MAVPKKSTGFEGQKAIVIPRTVLAGQCEKNPVISGLYLTDIGYYPRARYHYRNRPHGADQHILIYCDQGEGVVKSGEETNTLHPGDFVFIPLKTPHRYYANDKNPWTIYWIHFLGQASGGLISLGLQQNGGYRGVIRYSSGMIGLFNEMYRQLEKGYSPDNLIFSNLCLPRFLSAFLYNEKFADTPGLPDTQFVDRVTAFMREHVEEELGLQDFASAVNLSVSHFSYLFRMQTGFPPVQYFNQLKIQKACQYLQFTSSRIKEISLNIGISDPHYFSRLFFKVMGQSPRQYREFRGSPQEGTPLPERGPGATK